MELVLKVFSKATAALLAINLFFIPAARADNSADIIGQWLYYKVVYKGQLIDPLDPKLVMTFIFSDDGSNTLAFHRKDEVGFCERRAVWYFDEVRKELQQKVTWANPENRGDCSRDPDFQVGHESYSAFRIDQDQLYLSVPLADETIELVWKRIP